MTALVVKIGIAEPYGKLGLKIRDGDRVDLIYDIKQPMV
jgi:hypothetical protein